MKIIEGMKELKTIERRMAKNSEKITEYASSLDSERLIFESEKEQRKEVASLVQANEDLMVHYLELKAAIERTNLGTDVDIEGKVYTIASLLVIQRRMAQFMNNTYRALNDSKGRALSRGRNDASKVVTFYDEKAKNEGLEHWENLYERANSRLEVVNATTDLVM